jgi:hypothetical protein
MFGSAAKMAATNVGALPVCEKDKSNFIGFITDRDIVVNGIAKGKNMNDKVRTCSV